MRPLTEYATVLFDCDGVILDSNRLKTECFRRALAEYSSDDVDAFIAYHEATGGVSRFAKFKYFFETYLPDLDTEIEAANTISRFSTTVEELLLECDLTDGVLDILHMLNARAIACFIVSGGAQDELRSVFKQRKLDTLFREIYGSPKPKSDIVDDLVNTGRCAEPVLFIGDARLDMTIAIDNHFDFLFVSGYSDWEDGIKEVQSHNFCAIRSFEELKNI